YVIVHSTEMELDYPAIGPEQAGGSNVLTKYRGRGGVPVNGFLRRLAFAAKFMDLQILFTTAVTKDTKIILNRYLPERFAALAPWLMYDPDPYLVVADGRLVWMCDAYTVTNRFPYSRPALNFVNYIRNSVKIVCDAYDGIPEYYVFDPTDPLIQCYQKVFPGLFKPFEQMPASLKQHIRYPQLLFTLQVQIYADYHMKDPSTFYQREDSWSIPVEKYATGQRPVEAYYVVMRLPGEKKPEFLLILPLTLRGREERNMVAWMAARCDLEHYGELIVYRLPKEVLCYGPMQIEIRIDQNGEFSKLNALWDQRGSRVIRGNLLAIPIDNSMLYVEPLYLVSTQAGGETQAGLPELRRVIAALGDRLAIGVTLDDALAKLFGHQPPQPETLEVQPEGPAAAQNAKQLLERALELDEEA
ncbi:MAG: UPF0182 family protein, partial [Armatimonadetes bacterium]|nr:UPF0182 family protein [Armatimonadota bacterium]